MDREINRQLIEKQAHEILEKFASALQKVEKEGKEEDDYVDREDFEREEIASSSSPDYENSRNLSCRANNEFKERILFNAPQKDENFIIAEKGVWK